MMHVYVLHSASLNRYYTGISRNRYRRVKQHRQGVSKWTSRADDWEVVFTTRVADAVSARALEKTIKKRGAARYLADQRPDPAAGAGQG